MLAATIATVSGTVNRRSVPCGSLPTRSQTPATVDHEKQQTSQCCRHRLSLPGPDRRWIRSLIQREKYGPWRRRPHDNRPDLLAVNSFGCGGPAVADQPGDSLDRNTGIRHQRDEAVPQFPRGPRPGVEPGRLHHLSELPADVRCVPRRADSEGNTRSLSCHRLPACRFSAILARPVLAQGIHASLRERERPP